MAKPGRPKGSGRGLVLLNVRLDPDVYQGFEEWRSRQIDPTTREPFTQAESARRLFRWALEQVGTVKELDQVSKGFVEGMRRGKRNWERAAEEAWAKLRGEEE